MSGEHARRSVCFNVQTRRARLPTMPSFSGRHSRHNSVTRGDNHSGPIVLVADDVEENRDGIEQLLSSDGYRVVSARNEDDAVDRARRRRPDLILVSLGGPPVDVVASAWRIRTRARLTPIVPVVIFCVPVLEEGAEVAIGSNIYVTRPDNFDQLRALIGRLLWDPASA